MILIHHLFVKSPASAGLKPGSDARASSMAATTAGPPCTCNSHTSSPVKLLGPENIVLDHYVSILHQCVYRLEEPYFVPNTTVIPVVFFYKDL